MKTILLTLLAATLLLGSCNRDNDITTQPAPVIELDSQSGIYTVKAGSSLTIAPTVRYNEGATYQWSIDGRTVSDQPTYTAVWPEAGSFYITFRVTTASGSDSEEIRVDVGALVPPVISLAIPEGGLTLLVNTDYTFTPDIQNSDEADFRCSWTLDGNVVSQEASYTFRASECGSHTIGFIASNCDGSDNISFEVEVVDRLPYTLSFPAGSFFAESTDRYVFNGGSICLKPIAEGFTSPQFEWFVDDVPAGCSDPYYIFTPAAAGEYRITVMVSDSEQAPTAMTRNITRGTTGAAATVKVTCVEESEADRRRPADGSSSEYWDKVYEYVPAPGQFINDTKSGFDGTTLTHDQAIEYATARMRSNEPSGANYVSLGGFGGYIVVGFDHSVSATAGEGEYDFAIYGNAFDSSSEPGTVWVMQDTNGNGLPDDEWYELAGSEADNEDTYYDYAVTYYRPAGAGMDVQWTDNRGGSGRIEYLGTFHPQEYYYPSWISADSYTLRGTRLAPRVERHPITNEYIAQPYDWGYADNYGSDVLSSGADGEGESNGFRIANARDASGRSVGLQYIDFVKVQCAVNATGGWIGEISTEVLSFKDLHIAR